LITICANYSNANSAFITASSTSTLTNKTFDANGTGNSLSNVEVADFAGSAIVTAAEGSVIITTIQLFQHQQQLRVILIVQSAMLT
jgi:hypothetical protein